MTAVRSPLTGGEGLGLVFLVGLLPHRRREMQNWGTRSLAFPSGEGAAQRMRRAADEVPFIIPRLFDFCNAFCKNIPVFLLQYMIEL